jgi:putative DNA primase/helicase
MTQKEKPPAGGNRAGAETAFQRTQNQEYPKDFPPPTLDEIERALYCIPADCPEAEWSAVGMAVASEFPTGPGFDLFDRWSQTAPEKYKAADLKSRWRRWTRGRGKTIATLFKIAREHGYRPNPNAPPPTAAELARREQERAERERQRRAAEAEEREAAAHAEARAAELWDKAPPAPASHGYLVRKGIEPHGLRLYRGNLEIAGMPVNGCLMVPALDLDGAVKSLQFIHPDIPGKDGKRNLPKASIKGRFWRLGEFTAAGPVYIAEGPATAASIHEATAGACTLCAFSAGNLEAVAVQVRERYPAAVIVLCPDEDPTGLDHARRAARAVAGLVARPRPTDAGGE